jgi:UDP:flavonoid glycosyltransferase YjiC (YdhE family)
MARIVFAWEFGGGLGHIQYDLPLAKVLKERGHEVICIMKHVIDTGKIFGDHEIEIMQAPLWQVTVKQLPTSYSYPETLFNLGYLVHGGLLSMAKAWKNLLDPIKPDLIVADHAPTALIATHGSDCKRVLYGTGFFSPPKRNPMPSIIPWVKAPDGLIEYSENKALQTINNVLEELGSPILQQLYSLFEVDEDFLATFKELDHYQDRKPARYWGPVLSHSGGESPKWPETAYSKKIFCYIKPNYPLFEQLLNGLQQIAASVIVFSPALPEKIIEKYQTDKLGFHQKPVDMHKACKETDMVICHAGHGTVAFTLLYGKPMLVLPEHGQIDQILTARNVIRIKAGLMLNTREKTRDFKGLIQKVLTETQFTENAQNFARKYEGFDSESQLVEIAERCEELIRLPL